jgi:hypothetical protein
VKSYSGFVGLAAAAAAGIALLAYLPIQHWSRGQGLSSLAAGCGISFLASCAGALPIAWAYANGGSNPAQAVLLATAIRFGTALLLVIPTVLVWEHRAELAVCTGVSYLLMLPLDSACAVRALKRGKYTRT